MPGAQQELIRISSGSQQDLSRSSSGAHQDLIRISSGSQQELIRSSSGSHQDLIRISSGSHTRFGLRRRTTEYLLVLTYLALRSQPMQPTTYVALSTGESPPRCRTWLVDPPPTRATTQTHHPSTAAPSYPSHPYPSSHPTLALPPPSLHSPVELRWVRKLAEVEALKVAVRDTAAQQCLHRSVCYWGGGPGR